MHGSKLPLKTWDLALYILTTGLNPNPPKEGLGDSP